MLAAKRPWSFVILSSPKKVDGWLTPVTVQVRLGAWERAW
jgi:hypothetical protein